MTDLELAIRRSKRLERRLRNGLGATGRGLHELTSSIEKKLPPKLVKRLRYVATLRNKIVHDLDYNRLDDRKAFIQSCNQAEREIDQIAGPGIRDSLRLTIWVFAALVFLLVVGLAIAMVLLHRRGVGLDFSLW